jgi:hypothetical protein
MPQAAACGSGGTGTVGLIFEPMPMTAIDLNSLDASITASGGLAVPQGPYRCETTVGMEYVFGGGPAGIKMQERVDGVWTDIPTSFCSEVIPNLGSQVKTLRCSGYIGVGKGDVTDLAVRVMGFGDDFLYSKLFLDVVRVMQMAYSILSGFQGVYGADFQKFLAVTLKVGGTEKGAVSTWLEHNGREVPGYALAVQTLAQYKVENAKTVRTRERKTSPSSTNSVTFPDPPPHKGDCADYAFVLGGKHVCVTIAELGQKALAKPVVA